MNKYKDEVSASVGVSASRAPDKGERWVARTIYAVLALLVLGMIVITVFLTIPNNDFEYTNGEMTVDTEEFTSDGIPVVRVLEPAVFNIDFCNWGVNTETQRFLDLYLPLDEEITDPKDFSRVGSFWLAPVKTYNGDIGRVAGCLTDVPQEVLFPRYPDQDRYYKFRLSTSWRVNSIRIDTDSVKSELFYYASEGSEIP